MALLTGMASYAVAGAYSLDIDLSEQEAYLKTDGTICACAPISSGNAFHPTPVGVFKILEKDANHLSTLYGRIVTTTGRLVRSDATGFDPLPPGTRFVPALMPFFMRFDGNNGIHAGFLPGFPASHGCVRLPRAMAQLFFERLEIGDTVNIRDGSVVSN